MVSIVSIVPIVSTVVIVSIVPKATPQSLSAEYRVSDWITPPAADGKTLHLQLICGRGSGVREAFLFLHLIFVGIVHIPCCCFPIDNSGFNGCWLSVP
jgi:hypothetical protein